MPFFIPRLILDDELGGQCFSLTVNSLCTVSLPDTCFLSFCPLTLDQINEVRPHSWLLMTSCRWHHRSVRVAVLVGRCPFFFHHSIPVVPLLPPSLIFTHLVWKKRAFTAKKPHKDTKLWRQMMRWVEQQHFLFSKSSLCVCACVCVCLRALSILGNVTLNFFSYLLITQTSFVKLFNATSKALFKTRPQQWLKSTISWQRVQKPHWHLGGKKRLYFLVDDPNSDWLALNNSLHTKNRAVLLCKKKKAL